MDAAPTLPEWAITRQFYRLHASKEWSDIPELQHPSTWVATQLDPGEHGVSFQIAWSGSSGVSELSLRTSTVVRRDRSAHHLSIILPMLGGTSRLFWNGVEAGDHQVINTANLTENWSLRGPGRLLTLSLETPAPPEGIGGARAPRDQVHLPDRRQRRAFHERVERLLALAKTDPTWVQGTRGRLAQADLGVLAFDLLRTGSGEFHASRAIDARRRRAFDEIMRFFESDSPEALTLEHVAQAVGISKRSLNYTCHDLFGLSPIELLRISRLNAVRRFLRQAQPGSLSIWKLAGDFGFWHPGRFAIAYRNHFGETPSQTLRGPRVFSRQ
jgi:AraC-like DNA-binding protein